MLNQMVGFFLSFFASPGIAGISLAIAFGVAWLLPYWPPLFSRQYSRWLWLVIFVSAILTLVAISFIQIPLQSWIGEVIGAVFSRAIIMKWLLLIAIPQILVSGLVQEGAKLVPTVIYWLIKGRSIPVTTGLVFGAVAGAGFGVFEAQWVHNAVFSSGAVNLLSFVERFFAVGFHIAAGALAGYGLARFRAWQFYLLAGGLHGLLNYSAVLAQSGVSIYWVEAFAAVIALVVTGAAVRLRWEKRIKPEIQNISPDDKGGN